MRHTRRAFSAGLGVLAATALLPRKSLAAYPDRPIRLIVPFAAGGNADIVGRLAGEQISKALNQTVIVENRGGAGGGVGAEFVAQSAPDGYTLLIGSNGPLTVNPFVQAKLGYDPLKDFAPIGIISLVPHALAVSSAVTAGNLQELIALSKQQQVAIGTAGAGSATHLTLERFNAEAGAKLVHVPYRGGGALVPDLIAGNIHGAMTEFSTALPHHRGGKTRLLAVAATQRSPLASEVPTMIEGGIKDFAAASYVGILAPAGTPPELVERLQAALAKALGAGATRDRLRDLGTEVASPELMTSAGFTAFLRAEFERSRSAAQTAGLKKE